MEMKKPGVVADEFILLLVFRRLLNV